MQHRAVLIATVLVVTVAGVAPLPVAAASSQATSCDYPLTITDASGTDVQLDSAPDRVIVLGGSATQTVWEVGAAEKVVGIDMFSTYLDGAGDVPVISQGIGAVQYEAALAENPDLVIVDGNSYNSSVTAEFRESGVPTVQLADASSFEDIYAKINIVGQAVGACDGAATAATDMRQRVNTVEEAVSSVEDRPSVYYPLGGGYTVGEGSFIHTVLTTAGAHNVVVEGNFTSPYPRVSQEWVVQQDIEWLIATYNPTFGQNASDPMALLPKSDAINQTAAYQSGNVIAVNANYLNQPAPRIVEPLETIAKRLHPEAYAAANRTTTTATPTTTESPSTTQPPTTTTPDNGGGGGTIPGFGSGIAILGLGGGALLARSRA